MIVALNRLPLKHRTKDIFGTVPQMGDARQSPMETKAKYAKYG